MIKLPVELKNNSSRINKTILSFAYESDLNQIYAFYCSRYENISYEEFLNLGFAEFMKKLNSIPENEPLYTIIKSRTINLGTIKDKNERKYWRELKKINTIPQIYLSTEEIYNNLREQMKSISKVDNLNKSK